MGRSVTGPLEDTIADSKVIGCSEGRSDDHCG